MEVGVYFTFPFPNAAFIGGQRLKEEMRYQISESDHGTLNFVL